MNTMTNVNQNSDDSIGEILCRICYTSDNKKFVCPCKCKGTIGLVHAECLEKWLVETGRNTCELCGAVYVTERELRYSAKQSLYIWFLTKHRHNFVHLNYVRLLRTDVIISLILTAMLLAAIFFGVNGADLYCTALRNDWPSTNKWTSVGLFLVLAAIVAIYFAWMIVAVKYHMHKWYWWWQHTLTIKLIADAVDVEAYRQELIRLKNEDEIKKNKSKHESIASTSEYSSTLEFPSTSTSHSPRASTSTRNNKK